MCLLLIVLFGFLMLCVSMLFCCCTVGFGWCEVVCVLLFAGVIAIIFGFRFGWMHWFVVLITLCFL